MLPFTLPNLFLTITWTYLIFSLIKGSLDLLGLSKKNHSDISVFLHQTLIFSLSLPTYFLGTGAFTNTIISCVIFLTILDFYDISITNKIFLNFLICVILGISEIAIMTVFSIFTIHPIEYLVETPLFYQIMKSFAVLIPFSVVKTLIISKQQKEYLRKFATKLEFGLMVASILVPLSSYMLINILLEISMDVPSAIQTKVMFCLILVLNLNILMYYCFKKCLDMAEHETDSRLLQEQIKFYESHFLSSQEHTDEIRKLKHDFKYHLLSALPKIVEDYKKTDDIDGIDTILGDIFHENHVKYTNIPMLDVILNYQVNKANKLNIPLDITSDYITQLNFDSQWLCVILGNALDNAIECCQNLEDKSIVCSMKERNLNLYITISNSFEEPLKFVDGIPLSKKTGYKNHGTGLKSILQLVEKNEGICHFSTEDNTFSINLILNFL